MSEPTMTVIIDGEKREVRYEIVSGLMDRPTKQVPILNGDYLEVTSNRSEYPEFISKN